MYRINSFFSAIIQFALLIDSSKQSHIKQTIKTFKSIGKTIKSPLFKTIGNNIKVPIMKTVGNTIKNSLGMFRRNKNTIKNIACGFEEKYLKVGYNIGSKSVKHLGEKGINNFKYITPLAARVGDQLVRAPGKKNIQTKSSAQMSEKQFAPFFKRSVEQMRGKEISSLLNKVFDSKPQLPFLFAAGGFSRLTEFNIFHPERYGMDPSSDLKGSVKEYIVDPLNGEHKSTQIWLHGLGDGAMFFEPFFASEVLTPMNKSTRVRMITAPPRRVGFYKGKVMNSWFDFKRYNEAENQYDLKEASKNCDTIQRALEEEIAKLDGKSEKVYIGGFCQGACMALHLGLGYKKTLGGIIGLSGFKFMETEINKANQETPVFLAHGEEDDIFFFDETEMSYTMGDFIRQRNVEFHAIESATHSVDMYVMRRVRKWVVEKIDKNIYEDDDPKIQFDKEEEQQRREQLRESKIDKRLRQSKERRDSGKINPWYG